MKQKTKHLKNLLLAGCLLIPWFAQAFTLHVEDDQGQPVSGFRWLLQEDTTKPVTPGVSSDDVLGLTFHTSYAPPVAKGAESGSSAVVNVPDGRYFVTVLPDGNYTMEGAPVAPGQSDVTVVLHPTPLPTAQITVFVFEDNFPINNAPDLPQERGLEGFSVRVEATVTYGIAGGEISQDAFGNPLGTTYQRDADGNPILDAEGNPIVKTLGTGEILTDANGIAHIRNLHPGKYGIRVVAPPGQGWRQVSTIEGTLTIDAWVKPGEPPFFVEFGPPGPHVFVGFVRDFKDDTVLTGGATVTGRIVNLHNAHPPDFTFWPGHPLRECLIGLNALTGGVPGRGLFAGPCNSDATFAIPDVPPGQYQLVVWDKPLDQIIAFANLTVDAAGNCNGQAGCDLGDVPVFRWFGSLEGSVFTDNDEDGFRDCVTDGCDRPLRGDEVGIPEQAINLRFRNGSLYQTITTDALGEYELSEVFPFFHWLVMEVDFTNFKATGATFVVDDGGEVLPGSGRVDWSYPSFGKLTPQPQGQINPNTGNDLSRTEKGVVLTEGFQLFLGQTLIADWGKTPYGPGENGGIAGIVYYATTRAEDDPRLAAAEPWEPGIPRVPVNLYADGDVDRAPAGNFPGPEDVDWDGDGVFDAPDGNIEDVNRDGTVTLADVDRYPFGWRDGGAMGPEDIDRNGNGVFDGGDAIQVTTTDSWDDNLPTDCPPGPAGPFIAPGGTVLDCYDGMRAWNQIRPGVFDGGYAFDSYFPQGVTDTPGGEIDGLPATTYIVEAVAPPTYEHVKEEDRNVDFGLAFVPGALPVANPPCVGEPHTVPPELSLFPGVPTPFAGQVRPLCDRKQVALGEGQNGVADFFLFTEVPVAGQIVGFTLNDLANEFDPTNPNFGEKFAPSWVPVSIQDFTGREFARVYTDEFGHYNALVPSTFTINPPSPPGVSDNMVTVCLNHPGPIPDPAHPEQFITDPFFQPEYSQFCYTFQYSPGNTTYLDTPVLPIAAFARTGRGFPLDCEFPDGTPLVHSVTGPEGGPYVKAGDVLTIAAVGDMEVPNPLFDPGSGQPKTITRHYGFGGERGTVRLGTHEIADADVVWASDGLSLQVRVSGIPPGQYQLEITRGDNGATTPMGVTVTVDDAAGSVFLNRVHVTAGQSIQDAIDAAAPGDLILVSPGTYNEMLILWKEVQLIGSGAFSTIVSATRTPPESIDLWRQKVQTLVDQHPEFLLPGQPVAALGFPALGAPIFGTEEGAGVLVLAGSDGSALDFIGLPARIDGFTVTGANTGGGITLNGNADGIVISNNRVVNNQGILTGGIRSGHPLLANNAVYVDASNDGVVIHHNHVSRNGGTGEGGAGGGIGLFTGSDGYQVMGNFICGNFTIGDGAGIAHLGRSQGGRMEGNTIVFNQAFNQGPTGGAGGGIFIGGAPPLVLGGLTPGAGSVDVIDNLILGNNAGSGDGGGIRLELVNGQDATGPAPYTVNVLNDIIANNVAGLAGGGISLQDALHVNIVHTTVANNDSTATAGLAFNPDTPGVSTPQPAGIVSRAHSPELAALVGAGFSDPRLENCIVWHNRAFHFDIHRNNGTGGLVPDIGAGETPVFSDLAVLGTAAPASLDPRFCLLTDSAGFDASNIAADPVFTSAYFNGGGGTALLAPELTTPIQVGVAFDEGGNFIDVLYGPLTLRDPDTGQPLGDYHLQADSPAIDSGDNGVLGGFPAIARDIDGQDRPFDGDGDGAAVVDRGADEFVPPPLPPGPIPIQFYVVPVLPPPPPGPPGVIPVP